MSREENRAEQAIDLDFARQRKASIDVIKNSEKFAVRAIKGQKEPARGWDPKTNSKNRSDELLDKVISSDDNLGVHLFGDIVDVDIDTDNSYLADALDFYLPPCSHVWGRKSRPRTHRLYRLKEAGFDPSDYSILQRLLKIDEGKVEVRGGRQQRGEYSLLPSSVHPSGEMYFWHDLDAVASTISISTPEDIIRGIRLSAAVAVLAPHWNEGMRNELTMAVSGFLHRVHSISEALESSLFAVDKDEAERFLRTLMKVAADDPADEFARMKTFHATWKKAEAGYKVTGGNRIRELTGDKEILSKLYTLMTDSPDVQQIESFLERFVIWSGPGMVIDLEKVERGHIRPFMPRPAFVNSHGNYKITIDGKRRLLADMLFTMDNAQRVDAITFRPDEPLICTNRHGELEVNQWSGFDIEPWDRKVSDADVSMFIDYVREVVCADNERSYKWVTAWLADIFRNPGNKCGTALVLVGKPGAGKSFLGHMVVGKIIGESHYVSTNSVESVTKDFNVMFDNKVLIQCDEAINSRQKAITTKLKALITDSTKKVEPKGVDAFNKPNHSRFIFTSNYETDAIAVSDGIDDRRYTVLKVSDARKDDIAYWNAMVKWVEDEDNLRKVLRWLQDLEYERSYIMRPLETEARMRIIEGSKDVFDEWLIAMAARGFPISDEVHKFWFDAPLDKGHKQIDRSHWPKFLSRAAAVRDYGNFVRRSGDRFSRPMDEQHIGRALRDRGLLPDTDYVYRPSVTYFDERAGVQKKTLLYTWNLFTFEQLTDYLYHRFGVEKDEFDTPGESTENINSTAESEDF